MRIKIIMFSENVGIPKTSLTIGLGALNVWIDGRGYKSATNDVGEVGYVVLETPEVDLGDVDADRAAAFANLHGKLVHYQMTISRFLKDGGIARVKMSALGGSGGDITQQSVEFYAENCRGAAVVAGPLDMTVAMMQQARTIAQGETLLDDGVVAELAQDVDQANA